MSNDLFIKTFVAVLYSRVMRGIAFPITRKYLFDQVKKIALLNRNMFIKGLNGQISIFIIYIHQHEKERLNDYYHFY